MSFRLKTMLLPYYKTNTSPLMAPFLHKTISLFPEGHTCQLGNNLERTQFTLNKAITLDHSFPVKVQKKEQDAQQIHSQSCTVSIYGMHFRGMIIMTLRLSIVSTFPTSRKQRGKKQLKPTAEQGFPYPTTKFFYLARSNKSDL